MCESTMDVGEYSGTKGEGHQLWAKLVPTDSRYADVEIRSKDTIICSETSNSSDEKQNWCHIKWDSDKGLAEITNLSLSSIIVDGEVVEEGSVNLKSGSKITSGPDKDGYISYTFELLFSEKNECKKLKITLDVENAKCSICLNIWHDVVTIAPCLHNFCNGCFSEWLRRSSTRSKQSAVCPQCRGVVHSVGKNHFLHNIEEAILQSISSPTRSDEEIALLDTYASIKSNLVLGVPKDPSRKRPFTPSTDGNNMDLPCPQCGIELGGFRCNRTTTHLQCQGCGGLMPSRPNTGVPQKCLGCDRAFCCVYWSSQGVDANGFNMICRPETFTPIVQHDISSLPDSVHQNNLYEKDVTERCIQQSGKTLKSVLLDLIVKFNNKEIDRSRLQLNHADTITSMTHLCKDCYIKFVDYLLYWYRVSLPSHLLPPDASKRENCWYGYLCRTQLHNHEHARKRNHVCRPTRGNSNA